MIARYLGVCGRGIGVAFVASSSCQQSGDRVRDNRFTNCLLGGNDSLGAYRPGCKRSQRGWRYGGRYSVWTSQSAFVAWEGHVPFGFRREREVNASRLFQGRDFQSTARVDNHSHVLQSRLL